MYQAGMRKSPMKCCLAVFFCIIGPIFLNVGIAFVAVIGRQLKDSEEFVIAGGIIIAVSIIVLIVGVLLCISLNKKSNSGTTLNNGVVMSGQPLVSGSAAPGPIGGFHLTQQQSAYPSAPPGWSELPDAPPSYHEATKTT